MPAPLEKAWVIAEQRDGRPTPASCELVSEAARLAGRVEAFCWGAGAAGCAGELGRLGLQRLYDLGDLGNALPARRVAAAMAEEAGRSGLASAVLAPMSYDGRDIAARLSVLADRPVLANVAGLEAEAGRLESAHELGGGAEVARAGVTDDGPVIVLVRAKSFAAEDSGGEAAEVVALEPPAPGEADRAAVVERHVEEASGPSLDEAAVVVSGGRGLGDAAAFALIEELAALLGGAPAASRAIVDAGWVPYAYQVGQTGRTVKPDVYLAFGISGAMQHLVGMKGAQHVVAVNKDASAPIFHLAELGVVGDVRTVLPALVAAVKAARGS